MECDGFAAASKKAAADRNGAHKPACAGQTQDASENRTVTLGDYLASARASQHSRCHQFYLSQKVAAMQPCTFQGLGEGQNIGIACPAEVRHENDYIIIGFADQVRNRQALPELSGMRVYDDARRCNIFSGALFPVFVSEDVDSVVREARKDSGEITVKLLKAGGTDYQEPFHCALTGKR
jgi:hypothetical protein